MGNSLNLIIKECPKLREDERLFLYKKIKKEIANDEVSNDLMDLINTEVNIDTILTQLLYCCESMQEEDLTKAIFEIWRNRQLLTHSQINKIIEFSKEPFV